MNRFDWWCGIALLMAALIWAGSFSRYRLTVTDAGIFRIDGYTGDVAVVPAMQGASMPDWLKPAR